MDYMIHWQETNYEHVCATGYAANLPQKHAEMYAFSAIVRLYAFFPRLYPFSVNGVTESLSHVDRAIQKKAH